MAKAARNVYLEQYALTILRKLSDETQVAQATYVRQALDEFFSNNIKQLRSAGINKTFILKQFRDDPDSYSLIPERFRKLLNLPPSIPEKK